MQKAKKLLADNVRKMFPVFFVTSFVIIGAVIAVFLYVFYVLEKNKNVRSLKFEKVASIQLRKQLIKAEFHTIISDLQILALQNELMEYIETGSDKARELMDIEYLEVCKRKRLYDQIRYIDNDGMEVCRVNFNHGQPQIVPKEKLQNKKDRYYVSNTLALEKEQFFVSSFDLNVENGVIEEPLKPTIRFGTPIYGKDGKKHGIIIINYMGKELIDRILYGSLKSPGNTMLVNRNGYWLCSENRSEEWGFMFPEKRDVTFQNRYPEEWKTISNSEECQIESRDGIFTSVKVCPIPDEAGVISNAEYSTPQTGKYILGGKEYHWFLVSHLQFGEISESLEEYKVRLLSIGIALLIGSSLISSLIARVLVRRSLSQVELYYSANYDPMTGLPNRANFDSRLRQALAEAGRYNHKLAVLYLDLDGFKAVNDSLGHAAGDDLLVQVGQRMLHSVRASDTVARLGGDEFTILLPHFEKDGDAERVAEKLVASISSPFTVKGKEVTIGASIGISLFEGENDDVDLILKRADNAMYKVKQAGKNGYKRGSAE
ncbi:MAG: GGDEF domain-containing protein [Planctomycetes bacterium]|nr:GGDEF domain-containing protein [Planctomycetota bacterium]